MGNLFLYPLFEYIGFVNSFDGASAKDQKQDEMQDQEAAPDQEGDMNDPDSFVSRMKSKQKPGFRSSTPDNKCGQVPPETGVKKKVVHSIPLTGHPGSNEDQGSVDH